MAAKTRSRFGIDHDALGIAPVRISVGLFTCGITEPQSLTLLLKHFYRVRRKPLNLDPCAIRQPLIVEARRIYSLLNVEPIINHAHEYIRHGCDNRWSAGRTEQEIQLVIFSDNGRR